MMKDAAVDLDGITPRGIGWISDDMLALHSGERKRGELRGNNRMVNIPDNIVQAWLIPSGLLQTLTLWMGLLIKKRCQVYRGTGFNLDAPKFLICP